MLFVAWKQQRSSESSMTGEMRGVCVARGGDWRARQDAPLRRGRCDY